MAETIKAPCSTCFGERNHEILLVVEVPIAKVDEEGVERNEVLQCAGCETVVLRRTTSTRRPGEDHAINVRDAYFPPTTSRRVPIWLDDLGDDTSRDLLDQIYVATQNGLNRLAAMGIRALVEHVMVKEVGDQGSFGANLRAFHESGHISAAAKGVFEVILEAGHATMHRAYDPSDQDIDTLLDTVETMLEQVYIHPIRAEEMKGRIPPRRR
jgi:hypothetical protein